MQETRSDPDTEAMIEQHFLDDTLLQLRKLKAQAEKAFAQIDDSQFFALDRSRGQQRRDHHEAHGGQHALPVDRLPDV